MAYNNITGPTPKKKGKIFIIFFLNFYFINNNF